MMCPKCKGTGFKAMKVLEAKNLDDGSVSRRRECRECGARFRTIESVNHEIKPRPYRRRKGEK